MQAAGVPAILRRLSLCRLNLALKLSGCYILRWRLSVRRPDGAATPPAGPERGHPPDEKGERKGQP